MTARRTMEEFAARAVRFGAVGFAATAVYFFAGMALVETGLHVVAAHVIAFAAGFLVSYFGQKRFTFRIRGRHRDAGPRFAIATAVLVAAAFLLVLALDALGVPPRWTIVANTVFYPMASFLLHNAWTFRLAPGPSRPGRP